MNIGVSGLGLIGGSLAAALRKYSTGTTIVGYDTDADSSRRALANGLIQRVESTFEELANSVEILFLTATTSGILEQIKILHSYSHPLIVTDVCSVKRVVMRAAASLSEEIIFIGGHPMAGSQKTGNENADADLFRGAMYVLCPPATGEIPRVISGLIKSFGAQILVLPADIHDKAVSKVSHIPQLMAVGMLNELKACAADLPDARRLAAGGFRDMTRIGESSFSVWKDILAENRDYLAADLESLILRLTKYTDLLRNGDIAKLEQEFTDAQEIRGDVSGKTK
jgi:prephenate dehydrogenase